MYSKIELYGKFSGLPIYWGEEFYDDGEEPEPWFFVDIPGGYTKTTSLDHALAIALDTEIISVHQCDVTAYDFVLATKPQKIINIVNIAEIRSRYQMGLIQVMLRTGNRFIAG